MNLNERILIMFEKYTSLGYRDDIQGLRALCSFIIMSFHIWIHKVSGGVDVFFVISGFLMASILLRSYFTFNKYNPMHFWSAIARRVFPSAYIVIMTTLVLSYFVLSPSFLTSTVDEIIATIFHMENIQLIRKSVNYLASDVPSSPVQQFWALSIQMQFYFILPLLMIPLAIMAKRMNSSWPMFLGVIIVALCSFSYSVVTSFVTPSSSYFDPAARLWEFLSGVLIYLMAVNVNHFGKRSATCLLGLIMILGGAIFIPSTIPFPGFIALIPVIGAGMVIISGVGGQGVLNKFLANSFMKFLGGISFSIYLWHWPILVFYKEYYDIVDVSLIHGAGIIVLSFLLALMTNVVVEKQVYKIPKNKLYVNILIGVVFFVPVAIFSLVVRSNFVTIEHELSYKWKNHKANENYVDEIMKGTVSMPIPRNELIAARRVLPEPYNIHCNQEGGGTSAKKCSFGDMDSETKVVLVGGSHALQWLPALRSIAKRNSFEIISMSKSSCPLGALKHSDKSCQVWNENVLQEIEDINPVAVITNSTRTSTTSEYIPEEYINSWKKINALGIRVIGIRDNPRFSYNVPDCAYKDQTSQGKEACVKQRKNSLLTDNPASSYSELIGSIDLSNWLCSDTECPVVNKGMLMYRDAHHVHLPYVKYLTAVIEKKMSSLLPDVVN